MLLRLWLLFTLASSLLAQLIPPDSSKWTVINHVAWNYAHDICFDPAHVGIDPHGWLELRTEVLASTCYNYNLDGSVKDGPWTSTYTSGMLQTKTFNFQYGTVESRIKFSGGQGTWPAFWTLYTNCQATYPFTFDDIGACILVGSGYGEIDIAEILHSHPVTEVNQLVWKGGQTMGCLAQPNPTDVSQFWHVFRLDWTTAGQVFYIDGIETCRNIFNLLTTQSLFILFDVMLDHGTGGTVDPATLPQTMYVDYVKVTANANTLVGGVPQTPGAIIFQDDFDYGPIGFNSRSSSTVNRGKVVTR